MVPMTKSRSTSTPALASPASLGLKQVYDALAALPAGLGAGIFNRVTGLMVPHAARMGFRVLELHEQEIRVEMPDRRSNRNHLSSLHAMALAHLGEYTTGLLLLYAVQPLGYRTILRRYSIEYLAKARGTITARAAVSLPKGNLDKKDLAVKAVLEDKAGVEVAEVVATWRVGKIPA